MLVGGSDVRWRKYGNEKLSTEITLQQPEFEKHECQKRKVEWRDIHGEMVQPFCEDRCGWEVLKNKRRSVEESSPDTSSVHAVQPAENRKADSRFAIVRKL